MSTNRSSSRSKAPAKHPVAVIEAQSAQAFVPCDENPLKRARTQWQFGDWQSLAQLDRATLQHHPDRAKLALYTSPQSQDKIWVKLSSHRQSLRQKRRSLQGGMKSN